MLHRIFSILVLALVVMMAQGVAVADEMTAQEIEQLEEKAKAGDVDAQLKLAVRCEGEKSRYYMKLSADSGHTMSQYILGMEYANDHSDKQNYKKAEHYLGLAANTERYIGTDAKVGKKLALVMIADLYYYGSRIKQDYKKAINYYKKLANIGSSYAQYKVGYMYLLGKGVKIDYKKARDYLELAEKQGSSGAQGTLGAIYYFALGVKKDYLKAKYYYNKSAEQGNSGSQYSLGQMYYNGEGVKQDHLKAKYYYKQAAEQGHKEAKKELKFLE